MSTAFTQTFKQTKPSLRPSAEDVFSHQRSASVPSLCASQSKPYNVFVTEIISAFNSLSTSSTAPTSSSTLRTFFRGAGHEAHVDGHQMKRVMEALQTADPIKVNEVIAFLKSMPDPTADKPGAANPPAQSNNTKAKTKASPVATSNKPLKADTKETVAKTLTKKEKQEQLDKELSEWDTIDKNFWTTQKSNDQTTGIVDTTSSKSPISPSWWFSSTASSSPEPGVSTEATTPKNPTIRRSSSIGFGSLRLSTKSKPSIDPSWLPPRRKKTLSTGEQIAKAAASLLIVAAKSEPKEIKAATVQTDKTSNLNRQASMPIIRRASLKALLPTSKSSLSDGRALATKAVVIPESSQSTSSSIVATIGSYAKQLLVSHQGPPSLHGISIYTFWWGYEIYIPHKSMETIQRVSNTTSIFFNILSAAISGVPGLAILVPLAQIIATWVGHQWSAIKAEDKGNGVVISAIWVLPVILASRPWDQPCCDNSNPSQTALLQRKKTLPSRLGL